MVSSYALMDPKAVISEVIAADTAVHSTVRELAVHDPLGRLRASVQGDGSVMDLHGDLLAYIEADGSVGAPDMAYIGEVTAPNEASVGFVTDKDDELVAEVDYGLGTIRGPTGSTIAAITRNGEVSGHTGVRCGILEGFSYAHLRTAAAYLTLVDPAFLEGK